MEEMRQRIERKPDIFELLTMKAHGDISSDEFKQITRRMNFDY